MDPKPVEGEEQAKKRRGRKKSKLEDMFPAYLQVHDLSVLYTLNSFDTLLSYVTLICQMFVIHCRRLSLGRH